MTSTPPPLNRQRGAALLLLLLVLGMAGASLAVNLLSPRQSDQQRVQATLNALAQAREALLGYALRHGRLPRPAISATDGRERPQACNSADDCSGLLPWVTLDLPGADAWGKRLRYSVTPELSVRGFDISRTVANKRVRTRGSDGQLHDEAGQAQCEVAAQCLPAVVYSSGSKNLGTSVQGVALGNGAVGNVDEQYNDRASDDFICRPATADPGVPGGEFDDLISWIPLQLLYQQMARAGSLQAQR